MRLLPFNIVVSEGVPPDTVLVVSQLSLDEASAATRQAKEYVKAGMTEPNAQLRAVAEALIAANKVALARIESRER